MNTQTMTIGFIGLGRMGTPMVQNLLKAGYLLKVYDIVPEKITALVELGARAADSPADAVIGVEVGVFCISPDRGGFGHNYSSIFSKLLPPGQYLF